MHAKLALAPKSAKVVSQWQKQGNGELKPIAIASLYLNDVEKLSIDQLELLIFVWGLERFRFHLYGKQARYFSNHQTLAPLQKRNKTNHQNKARLTRRWTE